MCELTKLAKSTPDYAKEDVKHECKCHDYQSSEVTERDNKQYSLGSRLGKA